MLVTYEDKRFWDHRGVDILRRFAAPPASSSPAATSCRGARRLSMQLARLIEPRDSRSLGSKLKQMLRAIQIERRLTKQEILERYRRWRPMAAISKAFAPHRLPILARSRSG
ncbi:transglycosylase domain-containing protein [Mesorhizobium atlanticum]